MVVFGRRRRLLDLPPEVSIEVKPVDGGMDVSRSVQDPLFRQTGRSPFSENTRIENGVVGKAYGLTELGLQSTAADKHIMAVAEYELTNGNKFLMRVLPAVLERWNGTAWLALTGALTGAATRYPSVLVASDLFLIANGGDKIQRWDGLDATAVADLSASAPVGNLLALSDDRLIVADIVNGTRDREKLQISKAGDVTDFADVNDGDTVILPEDPSERPSPIVGLSAFFGSFFVYRSHSIWAGIRTGISSSPFAFQETAVDVGLKSPKSLARYAPVGDIFLGPDALVYVFSGGGPPRPVGLPVQRDMVKNIQDFTRVYGVVDLDRHEYWLIAPTGAAAYADLAWVWSIDPWVTPGDGRLVWRRRVLPREIISMGFGDVPISSLTVDDETRAIDDVTELFDAWQRVDTFRALHFGGANGLNRWADPSSLVDENVGTVISVHDLPELGTPGEELMLDRAYIEYRADAPADVELSLSLDGGQTYTNAVEFTLPTAQHSGRVFKDLGVIVEQFLPRIRFHKANSPELIGVRFVAQKRGVAR